MSLIKFYYFINRVELESISRRVKFEYNYLLIILLIRALSIKF